MIKSKILAMLGIIFLSILAINLVSASSHGTFDISEKWSFREDISDGNRDFAFKHSFNLPRNTCGFYNWSANPNVCIDANRFFPRTRDPDRLVLEAFRTFQQDSAAQNAIQLERERRKFFSFGYPYSYPRFYGHQGYYPRYYGY